jgi:thioredoxin
MSGRSRFIIYAVVIIAAVGAIWIKRDFAGPSNSPVEQAALPTLIDLGADKCVPCKMMAPILDGLREEYAGRMDVIFIDVWKDRAAGEPYNIQSIPTQIFLSPDGTELFRHTGFYAREDILAKWSELGYDLES